MKKIFLFLGSIALSLTAMAQPKFVESSHTLETFIPKTLQLNGGEVTLEGKYDKAIPTPKEALGFEIGARYCEWSDVLYYAETLAKVSDRVRLVELGRTYEARRFVQLVISSPKNIANLDQIKADHLKLIDPAQSASLDTKQMPLISNITCSIHGGEASGVNAAMAMAYFFAASQDAAVLEMLDNMVLLLVPGSNPDGINRFAHWCNTKTGNIKTGNKASEEYKHPWPGGRTNHYWADENRDLLMCQHPEGKVAVTQYLDWMPNLVLDLHEKGSKNNTFFHSPGPADRLHPYVSLENQSLTGEVGAYVSNALTPIGANPYSGRGYDDFYLGKGAAYGDVQGSVCLLYEQPNTRTFKTVIEGQMVSIVDGIRNQAYGCIAALCAGCDIRVKLLDYQRDFYKKSAEAAKSDKVKGYVFQATGDRARAWKLLENLMVHGIKVYNLAKDIQLNKQTFKAGEAFVIPLEEQTYFYKTKAIWERLGLDAYKSNVFYDISTWTFPLAYNVEHADMTSVEGLVGAPADMTFPAGAVVGEKGSKAYVFDATGLYSVNLLRALLLEGVNVGIAQKPFKVDDLKMSYGSAVVELAGQTVDAEKIHNILTEAAKMNGVNVYTTNSLKSDKLKLAPAQMPEVAMLVNAGSSSVLGEILCKLERQYGLATAQLNANELEKKSLNKYNVIISTCNAPRKGSKTADKLRKWVEAGGTLITVQSGYKTANNTGLTDIKTIAAPEKGAANKIKGTIVNTTIDNTTPLGYGYVGTELPIMKRNNTVYAEPTSSNTIVPLRFTAQPYLSGYISQTNIDRIASAPVATVTVCGKGCIVHFAENITFRSYWYGASKMLMNAVYFGHLY